MIAPRRKQSAIWAHYDEIIGKPRARCKICSSSISIAGGSLGNLNRHLRMKHKQVFMNTISKRENIRAKVAKEVPKVEILKNRIDVNPMPEVVPIGGSLEDDYTNIRGLKNYSKPVSKHVSKPDSDFIQIVSKRSRLSIPNKKKLPKTHDKDFQNDNLSDLKNKIYYSTGVCLGIYYSQSQHNCSFFATAYFIDDNTHFNSCMLATDETSNVKPAPRELSNFLRRIIFDFGIKNKLKAIVSEDDPTNISIGIQYKGFVCFVYSLQQIVDAALCEIPDIITKIKRICEYCRTKLEILRHTGLSGKEESIAIWISKLDMLLQIDPIYDDLVRKISMHRPDLLLSTDERILLAELVPILKPFYEVAIDAASDKCMLLSKGKVLYNLVKQFIKRCASKHGKVSCIILIIKRELYFRFREYERSTLINECVLLDPRFKRNGFTNIQSYEKTVENVQNTIYKINQRALCGTEKSINNRADNISNQSDVWDEINQSHPQNDDLILKEFHNYLSEECLDKGSDPFVWWQKQRNTYPQTYAYAMQRLCTIASSKPCDSIHSVLYQVFNENPVQS